MVIRLLLVFKHIFRWDGVRRPKSELNMSLKNWPYKIIEYPFYYQVERKNRSIKLPKKSWFVWDFQPYSIRPKKIKINNLVGLTSISVVYNSTMRYIDISELVGNPEYLGKLIKIGDFTWDSKLDIYDSSINIEVMHLIILMNLKL